MPLSCRQQREPHRHAGVHPLHIGLRDACANRHRAQVGNPHHPWRLVGGVERLPLTGIQSGHRPVHRRIDAGVGQARFLGPQRGPGLPHARLQAGDPRLRQFHLGLGVFQIFLCDGFLLQQMPPALQLPACLSLQHLLLVQLGLQGGQRGPGAVHHRLLHVGIDFQQQLAASDGIADLYVDVLDLARYLRPHVHRAPRLQRARGRHQQLDVAVCHLRHRRWFIGRLQPPPATACEQGDQQQHGNPASPAPPGWRGIHRHRCRPGRFVRRGPAGRGSGTG